MSLCLSQRAARVVGVLVCWAISAQLATAQPPVTVSAADPSVGEQETMGLIVKVTGKNFSAGARADFFRSGTSDPAGITVRATRYVSATEVEATLDISAGAALSLFDIRVTNTNGRSGKGSDLFQVVQKGNAKPVTSIPATATFRCYSDPGVVPPDPCLTPVDGDDNTVDRARDDSAIYGGGFISASYGFYDVYFDPSQSRTLNLLFGILAGVRGCDSIGNCNPDGPLTNQNRALQDFKLRVKPLVSGTWEDFPGGLLAMTCGPVYPGLVHFTFWLPSLNGHWGLNFNPRAYAPSTAVSLTRVDNLTWTAEATTSELAALVSFAHSGIRRKNGPSQEGFFRMPFKATIAVASLPSGAVTCN